MTTIYNWYNIPWAVSIKGDFINVGWELTGVHVGHTLVRTIVHAHCRMWVDHQPPGFPEPQPDGVAFAYFQSKQIRSWQQLPTNPYDSSVEWAYWNQFSFMPGFGYVTDLFLQGTYEANIDAETHAQRKATADLPLGCIAYSNASGAGDIGVSHWAITGNGVVRQLWRHESAAEERSPYAPTAHVRVDVRRSGELAQHLQYSVGSTVAPAGTVAEQEEPV